MATCHLSWSQRLSFDSSHPEAYYPLRTNPCARYCWLKYIRNRLGFHRTKSGFAMRQKYRIPVIVSPHLLYELLRQMLYPDPTSTNMQKRTGIRHPPRSDNWQRQLYYQPKQMSKAGEFLLELLLNSITTDHLNHDWNPTQDR